LVLILIPAGVVTESHGVGAVMAQRMRAGPETPGFTCKVPEIAVEIKLKSKKSLFPQRFRRSLRRRGNLPSRRREIRLVAAVSR